MNLTATQAKIITRSFTRVTWLILKIVIYLFRQPSLPIYVSVKGIVFDVSDARGKNAAF